MKKYKIYTGTGLAIALAASMLMSASLPMKSFAEEPSQASQLVSRAWETAAAEDHLKIDGAFNVQMSFSGEKAQNAGLPAELTAARSVKLSVQENPFLIEAVISAAAEAPEEGTEQAAAENVTEAPAEGTGQLPAETVAEAPEEGTEQAAAETVTEAPVEGTEQLPAEQLPAETVTEAQAEGTVQAAAEAVSGALGTESAGAEASDAELVESLPELLGRMGTDFSLRLEETGDGSAILTAVPVDTENGRKAALKVDSLTLALLKSFISQWKSDAELHARTAENSGLSEQKVTIDGKECFEVVTIPGTQLIEAVFMRMVEGAGITPYLNNIQLKGLGDACNSTNMRVVTCYDTENGRLVHFSADLGGTDFSQLIRVYLEMRELISPPAAGSENAVAFSNMGLSADNVSDLSAAAPVFQLEGTIRSDN